MATYRITLDAWNTKQPIRDSIDMCKEWRARVRLYVTGETPINAMSGIGTVYVRHSDGTVTLDGGLGHDQTTVYLPEWVVVTSPRKIQTLPNGIGRKLPTGGTVAGMVVK